MRACFSLLAALATSLLTVASQAAPGSLMPGFGTGGKTLTNFVARETQAMAMALSGTKVVTAGYVHNGTNYDFVVIQFNADGSLDSSFGTFGRVILDFGAHEWARGVVVQADGKIVVGGGNLLGASNFTLVRLYPEGLLDDTFGDTGTGTVQTSFGASSEIYALALQADGKIVAAGTINGQNFAIARYTPDGILDTNFGCATPGTCTGKVVTDFGGFDRAYALVVQPDGKIVAAGHLESGSAGDFALARYNANGLLDDTFGCATPGTCTGKVTTSFTTGNDEAHALAIQPDGKLVAGGFSGGLAADFALARYNANGTLDTSFGLGGKLTTDLGSSQDYVNALAVQPDGKIVVAGSRTGSGANSDAVVARYESNGFLDQSFGCPFPGSCGGVVVGSVTSLPDDAKAVALRGDGRILTAGFRATNPGADAAVLSFNANGTADFSFGTAGRAFANAGSSADQILSLAYASSRILAAGSSDAGSSTDFAIARYLESGVLDTAFGTNGKVTLDFTGGHDYARAVLVQPADGKVVLAGGAVNGLTNNFAVARLLSGGAVDGTFGVGGRVLAAVGSAGGAANAAGLQADGKIVAAGYANRSDEAYDFGLARFNTNGSLDASFGGSGAVTTMFGADNSEIEGIAIQADGKIVAAGFAGANAALARYNANGTLDTSFGCATPGTCSGKVTIAMGVNPAEFNAVLVMADGRIVAAGSALAASGYIQVAVARFNANGTPDTSFGNGGVAMPAIVPNMSFGDGIALDSSNRLVISGRALDGTYAALAVRLTPSGALDTTFGAGGKTLVHSGASDAHAIAVTILPSAAIVIGGAAIDTNVSGSADFFLAALEGGGALMQADFNADAHPDIIWSNADTGATYVWYMTGPPPVLVSDAFIAGIDPSWKVQGVADFNADGKPDLVWRNTATGNTYVWYMDGPSFVSDAFVFSLPPEWVIQGVADFNADGRPDFLMRNTSTGVAFVWFFNNATAIGDQFLFGIDPMWKVEQVGDMNADNQPDLLFRNMSSGLAFAWYTQYSGGSLSLAGSSSPIFSIDPVWEIVQLEDWNGDANRDLLFRNTGSGVVFVWYMTGVTLGGSDYVIQIDPPWEIVPRR